jgi:hypothetical protein
MLNAVYWCIGSGSHLASAIRLLAPSGNKQNTTPVGCLWQVRGPHDCNQLSTLIYLLADTARAFHL